MLSYLTAAAIYVVAGILFRLPWQFYKRHEKLLFIGVFPIHAIVCWRPAQPYLLGAPGLLLASSSDEPIQYAGMALLGLLFFLWLVGAIE